MYEVLSQTPVTRIDAASHRTEGVNPSVLPELSPVGISSREYMHIMTRNDTNYNIETMIQIHLKTHSLKHERKR